ncbi:hypothetical protein BB559_003359 [Furculomyces boomerangus]|uniref:Histone deacetylase domain-containing protein n=2 Tax=Harpellales TaxID=61421 RepID=A0A2T9YLQ6_9FUNG|nr:hypothetical protein BB559_003359 [Furculomyces boomerangus]PWA00413.1 hypothetical protein BB558_003514 [Smittium angustum]
MGKVVLIKPRKKCEIADLLPSNIGRASMVHSLIESFEELYSEIDIKVADLADISDLKTYHNSSYIDYLMQRGSSDDKEFEDKEDMDEFYGLQYDCYPFDQMTEYVQETCGGTLSAVSELLKNRESSKNKHKKLRLNVELNQKSNNTSNSDSRSEFEKAYSEKTVVAIHWEGGRHHGHKSNASGFCYINDIVIGILKIQKSLEYMPKIMYIDLDLHHGNGVQNAFFYSNNVLSLSIHHFDHETRFFPFSGGEILGNDSESKLAKNGMTLNVPLKKGLNDENFIYIFDEIVVKIVSEFNPEYIVVQCGCDGLAGDPANIWNLTIVSYLHAIRKLLEYTVSNDNNLSKNSPDNQNEKIRKSADNNSDKKRLLVLGGGGYNNTNVARCWTAITLYLTKYFNSGEFMSFEEVVDTLVPDHEFIENYSPYYDLSIEANHLQKDENTREYLDFVIEKVQSVWCKST